MLHPINDHARPTPKGPSMNCGNVTVRLYHRGEQFRVLTNLRLTMYRTQMSEITNLRKKTNKATAVQSNHVMVTRIINDTV